MRRGDRFDAILVETTGLADPAPVAQTFFADGKIRQNTELDAIAAVVDTQHVLQQIERAPEAQEQIAFADVVIVNKIDLFTTDQLARVEECIRRVDGTASIRPSTRCDVALEDVLDRGAFDLDRILGIDVEFLDAGHQPEHDHDVSSFSLESAVPLEGGHQCRWAPNETRASRMIFIGRNLPRDVIRNGFMECRAVRPLSALSARL